MNLEISVYLSGAGTI